MNWIFGNRWIQLIIILAIIFGLLMITGINFNFHFGAAGIGFSANK